MVSPKRDAGATGASASGSQQGGGSGASASGPAQNEFGTKLYVQVVKDGMRALDTTAKDMNRELATFFEKVERFFRVAKMENDDANKVEVLRSVLGDSASDALVDEPGLNNKTYAELKELIQTRFKPVQDDVHALVLVRQCAMRQDETTKEYVNRLRALVAGLQGMSDQWRVNEMLASLRMAHRDTRVRELLAEKMPKTVAEAEKLAEQFDTRQKEKPVVDRMASAMVGMNNAANIEFVKSRGRGQATGGSSGRPGPPGKDLSGVQCFLCKLYGHVKANCPVLAAGMAAMRGRGQPQRGFPRAYGQGRFGSSRGGYRGHGVNNVEPTGENDVWTATEQQEGWQAAGYGQPATLSYNFDPNYAFTQSWDPSAYGLTAAQQMEITTGPATGGAHLFGVPILETDTQVSAQEWWVDVRTRSATLRFKADTGAKVNVCSLADLAKLGFRPCDLQGSNVYLIGFNRAVVYPVGALITVVEVNGVRFSTVIHVVEQCNSPLLCCKDLVRAGLIKIPSPDLVVSREPREPVESVAVPLKGRYKYEKVHLVLRADAVPKQFPPRKVPLALKERTRLGLEQMEKDGVIARVNEPTEWCHAMTVAFKPNGVDLRICMDPRYLNQFLIRPIHPFPDIDEIFALIQGCKFLTKIDMRWGFWNLELDEESSFLCTFATEWGRYRYLRLPFGVSVGPEVFHRIVGDILRGIPGVIHFIDDILAGGRTDEEHDERVVTVKRRLKDARIEVNDEKCEYKKTQLTFLGHLVSGDGIQPDPSKLDVLKQMPAPTSNTEMHSFLGFVTYLGRYVPNFSAVVEPLRRLQNANVVYEWTSEQQKAFEEVKRILLSAPILKPFDPTKPLCVYTDASNLGLGGVLVQDGDPVTFVSRSLLQAEKRYPAIEKELLAVKFVLKRCKFYTLGRPVKVFTDHKPLVGLAAANFDEMSPRLRRLAEALLEFDIQWEYITGKNNYVADYLSRIPRQGEAQETSEALAELTQDHPDDRARQLLRGGQIFQRVAQESLMDDVLKRVRACVLDGWPKKPPKDDSVRYWPMRMLLSVSVPFVMYGERVCVPSSLRSQVLTLLHEGHPGVSAMKMRALRSFYWPGITSNIYDRVMACIPCSTAASHRAREPLFQEAPPEFPGDQVAADFFHFVREIYLVFYDLFAGFPFVHKVSAESKEELIRASRTVFLQTGYPRVFMSDGGPAFASDEFASFLAAGGVRHRVSSAQYAQSNGAAERAVQTVKLLREKATTPQELFRALLYFQNTPRPDCGLSPSELFFGRSQRVELMPVVKQNQLEWKLFAQTLLRRQEKARASYDAKTRGFEHNFKPDETVVLRNYHGKVVKGQIVGPAPTPRAYYVRMPSGHVTCRNQRFLIPVCRSAAGIQRTRQVVGKEDHQRAPTTYPPKTSEDIALWEECPWPSDKSPRQLTSGTSQDPLPGSSRSADVGRRSSAAPSTLNGATSQSSSQVLPRSEPTVRPEAASARIDPARILGSTSRGRLVTASQRASEASKSKS